MSKPRWHVRLGPHWSRFSPPRHDLQLLGTVQVGAQIGALGQLPDGRYVQVNGDVLSPIKTHPVQAAINAARQQHRQRPPLAQAAAPEPVAARKPAPASVTITVRKRRIVNLPSPAPSRPQPA